MELRTSDVRPDYSGLVKSQVKTAKRFVKGEEVGYEGLTNPTTEFLNETVDRFGGLHEIQGSLPTPHLLAFSEEPQKTGGEWEATRQEMLPVSGPDGRVKSYECFQVTYQGRVEAYGDDGTEFADITFTGLARRGGEGDEVWQEYATTGEVRFAIRDGHVLTAKVNRQMTTHLEQYRLISTVKEEYEHAAHDTERAVGGMRL